MCRASDPAAPADPLDVDAAPFGTFAPPRWMRWARNVGRSTSAPRPVRRLVQNALASRVKRRGQDWYDLDYGGLSWRLAPKENWGDRAITLKAKHSVEADVDMFDAVAGRRAVFVDAGANVGFYSLAAALRLGPGARILAIEPHPTTARKLRANIALNADRIAAAGVDLRVAETALGAAPGRLPLHAPRAGDVGSNSLHDSHAGAPSVEVAVTPLADLVAAEGLERIDVLKIDVEGFEAEVLPPFFAAAPERLWPETVLIEVVNRGKWAVDVIAEMARRGYRIDAETREDMRLTRPRAAAANAQEALHTLRRE